MPTNQKGFTLVEGLVIAAVICVVGFIGWSVYGRTKNRSSSPSSSTQAKPSSTIDQTGALKVKAATANNCQVLLPDGWDSPSVNKTSTTIDAFSPDKSMYVGYGHQTINTTLAPYAGTYQAPLNDSDLYSNSTSTVALAYSKIIVGNLGGDQNLEYDATIERIGKYKLRSFESSTHKGMVFFHSKGFAGNGINYTYSLPMYFALATKSAWQQHGLSLARIATSVSCNAQLEVRGGGPDLGDSSSSSESNHAEDDDNDGYNAQLGTEYVHDSNTRENYVVDPSRDWSSGPDGDGYYKANGNDYTKLEPGRSD